MKPQTLVQQKTRAGKPMADQPNVANVIREDEIKHIPLSDISVHFGWNSRSHANVLSDPSENATEPKEIRGLTRGIFLDGQAEAVVVRPTNTEGFYKKGKQP